MRRLLMSTALASLLPLAAAAEDRALILGTDRYAQLGRTSRGADVLGARNELQELGYAVTALRNAGAEEVFEALDELADAAGDAEILVLALSGKFVTDGGQSWYLAADAAYPTLFGLQRDAVPVASVMEVLARQPGRALLLLGVQESDDDEYGPYLRAGLAPLDVPQGVTVITGEPRAIGDFLEDEVGRSGRNLIARAGRDDDLEVMGFRPRSLVLEPARPDVPDDNPSEGVDSEDIDRALWRLVAGQDTADAYRSYLRRFPNGIFASEARNRLEAIEADPERDAREAEERLDLSRDERREIQRNLSILDFNTRGIDGIFGPGTRGAITNWQQQNGYPQTGFLTAEQVARLDGQASRRAAELEREAELRRQEEARADRAFWEETGAEGDEAGYRTYLERYPDGIFSDVAEAELAEIEERRRAAARAQDREDWDDAREADTVRAYRRYLEAQPEGAFRQEARARINALQAPEVTEAQIAEARQQERRIGLNPITVRLVEARLDELGLQPGRVDGRIDDDTRRAIRRYQRARNLVPTGYLTEPTLVRLLADSINR